VKLEPEAIAAVLIARYGLPDGSVAMQKVGLEITPLGINDRLQ
jgi:hypothetical protein